MTLPNPRLKLTARRQELQRSWRLRFLAIIEGEDKTAGSLAAIVGPLNDGFYILEAKQF
jgi:hypothetical protein